MVDDIVAETVCFVSVVFVLNVVVLVVGRGVVFDIVVGLVLVVVG